MYDLNFNAQWKKSVEDRGNGLRMNIRRHFALQKACKNITDVFPSADDLDTLDLRIDYIYVMSTWVQFHFVLERDKRIAFNEMMIEKGWRLHSENDNMLTSGKWTDNWIFDLPDYELDGETINYNKLKADVSWVAVEAGASCRRVIERMEIVTQTKPVYKLVCEDGQEVEHDHTRH